MKKASIFIFGIGIALVFALSGGLLTTASAQSSSQGAVQDGVNAAHGEGQPTTLFGDSGVIGTVTNVLLFLAGALAVIMIIFGGLRYVTSGGNASSVTAAKNTIMYALVGLIIAFLAFALVNWILGAITPGVGSGYTTI